MKLIEAATNEKHVGETSLNHDSSRSHTFYYFNLVRVKNFAKEVIATCRLVDLAGSERSYRTNVTGDRSKEANHINSDLLFLMNCLRNCSENPKENSKISFRNCKLTYLLSVGVGIEC